MMEALSGFPHVMGMLAEIGHDDDSVDGSGCDDDVEFTFALDLILDGPERLRDAEATRWPGTRPRVVPIE